MKNQGRKSVEHVKHHGLCGTGAMIRQTVTAPFGVHPGNAAVQFMSARAVQRSPVDVRVSTKAVIPPQDSTQKKTEI